LSSSSDFSTRAEKLSSDAAGALRPTALVLACYGESPFLFQLRVSLRGFDRRFLISVAEIGF